LQQRPAESAGGAERKEQKHGDLHGGGTQSRVCNIGNKVELNEQRDAEGEVLSVRRPSKPL